MKFEYSGIDWMTSRVREDTRVEFKYDPGGELLGIENEHDSVYSSKLDANGEVMIQDFYILNSGKFKG